MNAHLNCSTNTDAQGHAGPETVLTTDQIYVDHPCAPLNSTSCFHVHLATLNIHDSCGGPAPTPSLSNQPAGCLKHGMFVATGNTYATASTVQELNALCSQPQPIAVSSCQERFPPSVKHDAYYPFLKRHAFGAWSTQEHHMPLVQQAGQLGVSCICVC